MRNDPLAGPWRRLQAGVLETPGKLPASLRRTLLGGDVAASDVPPAFHAYLEKVATRAWTVTDEDVAALRQAGLSDDQIFEATVATAVGAGLTRLRAGLGNLWEDD